MELIDEFLLLKVCGVGVIRFEHMAVLQNIQESPGMNTFIFLYSQAFCSNSPDQAPSRLLHILN